MPLAVPTHVKGWQVVLLAASVLGSRAATESDYPIWGLGHLRSASHLGAARYILVCYNAGDRKRVTLR